jgi:hypothetical protein
MAQFGEFNYGFDEELNRPNFGLHQQAASANGLGGGVGAQVGSQTGGSGAGMPSAPPTPAAPTRTMEQANSILSNAGVSTAETSDQQAWVDGRLSDDEFRHRAASRGASSGGGGGVQESFSRIRNLQGTAAQIRSAQDPMQRAALSDQLARGIAQTLQQQGHEVSFDGGQLVVDGRPYVIPTFETWQPTGVSGYQPGAIGTDDIPQFSFESLLQQMGGPVDEQTAALVSSILQNPESLSPLMVDTLKARSKDELADLYTGDMARLRELGVSHGIQDSPWLAAEEMDARGRRNSALVASNRDIDIEAARTNFGDRLNAASAGTAFTNARAGRVQAAGSLALARAAATGDRLALRESVNQQAAQLGISAQQVLGSYLAERAADANRRWGLQLEADRLSMMDRQFQEELALKLEQLAQADAQFRAQHDLNVRQQQFVEEEADWRRSLEG